MKMKPAEIPEGSGDTYDLIKKGDRSPGQRRARLPTWRVDLGRNLELDSFYPPLPRVDHYLFPSLPINTRK